MQYFSNLKISTKINLIIFFMVIPLISAGYFSLFLYSRMRTTEETDTTIDLIVRDYQSYYREMITNIVLGQHQAINQYLNYLVKEKNLQSAVLVSEKDMTAFLAENAAICNVTKEPIICRDRQKPLSIIVSLSYGGQKYGYLKITKETLPAHDILQSITSNFGLYLVSIFVFLLLIFIVIAISLEKIFSKPIKEICDDLKLLAGKTYQIPFKKYTTHEIKFLVENITNILKELENAQAASEEHARHAAIVQTTRQIAHDLKNPINAAELELNKITSENFLSQSANVRSALARVKHMAEKFKRADIEGLVQQNWQILDWSKVIAEMAAIAHDAGCRLHLNEPERISIRVDADKINRSTMNLNKWKLTQKCFPTLATRYSKHRHLSLR